MTHKNQPHSNQHGRPAGFSDAERFARDEFSRFGLTDNQIETAIGWMTAAEGYPMIIYGKGFGLIAAGEPDGRPPIISNKCKCCGHIKANREKI